MKKNILILFSIVALFFSSCTIPAEKSVSYDIQSIDINGSVYTYFCFMNVSDMTKMFNIDYDTSLEKDNTSSLNQNVKDLMESHGYVITCYNALGKLYVNRRDGDTYYMNLSGYKISL